MKMTYIIGALALAMSTSTFAVQFAQFSDGTTRAQVMVTDNAGITPFKPQYVTLSPPAEVYVIHDLRTGGAYHEIRSIDFPGY